MKDGLKGEPNPRREEHVGNSMGIQGQQSWPKLEEGSIQIQDTFRRQNLRNLVTNWMLSMLWLRLLI